MKKSDELRTRRDKQRRKYSKMDKRAKDKLVRSPRKNGGARMPKKIFTQELEWTRRRKRPRKRWKEEVETGLQVLGVRRLRELVPDRKQIEGHCSTGQSPQWAVVPVEEEVTSTLLEITKRVGVFTFLVLVFFVD
jgi:hypothetical protein